MEKIEYPTLVPTTTPQIKVKIKNNYGVDIVYPICQKAKLFAQIAGTTTLPLRVLTDIMFLGYEIIEEPTKFKFGSL